METGTVTLDATTVAPAIVVAEGGNGVTLWGFLPTGPIRFEAQRGDDPGVGVFVSDG